jgi:hypothetical protein
MAPSRESLLNLFKRKLLNDLYKELDSGRTTFEEMMALSKDDWERYYGINGIAIYNHLHPKGKISLFPQYYNIRFLI